MKAFLKSLVWRRAKYRCEYCQMPFEFSLQHFEIDHVKAKVHGGLTVAENLALACFIDNNRKGTNLSGVDPRTEAIVRLFHPRLDKWSRHFRWQGPMLLGRTRIGRATATLLEFNDPLRVLHRQVLIDLGVLQSS